MFFVLICCFLVGKAAPGTNINIHVNIEEGEIAAALAIFATLLIWLSFLSVLMHGVTLCSVGVPVYDFNYFSYNLHNAV